MIDALGLPARRQGRCSASPKPHRPKKRGLIDETCFKTYYQVMNKPFKPTPVLPIMADVSVSISELKKNPAAVIEEARKRQVAITSRNRAVAYVVSPEVWDHICDVFEDRKLIREAEAALAEDDGNYIAMNLDDYL